MAPASATMPNFSGCVVGRQWQILRMLGSGTYGVVYEAVDLHPRAALVCHCAVKILQKAGRTAPQLLAMYEEVRLHELVSKHPNVTTIHDAFEDDEYCYIVLRLCHGGDLFNRICGGLYLNNDELIRRAFITLIDALQECHERTVFHRDLKPENILTNEDGSQLYLTDFGLASDRTIVQYEHGVGTANYMSPECVGRMTGYKPYCSRFSDIWSLGIVLINMLSGQNPWSIASLEDSFFSRFVDDPDYFKKLLPITDGANAIILRLLALNPLQRISLEDLRKAILTLDAFFLPEGEFSEDDLHEYETALEYPCADVEGIHVEVDIGECRKTVCKDPQATPLAGSRSTMVLRPARFSTQSESDSDDESDISEEPYSY